MITGTNQPFALPVHVLGGHLRCRARWLAFNSQVRRSVSNLLERALDVVLSLALLVALSPLVALRSVAALVTTGRLWDRQVCVGARRTQIGIRRLAGSGPGRNLGLLVEVLQGKLSFLGPRPLAPSEAALVGPSASVRFAVKPGLISLHALRQRTRVAHQSELESDRELYYADTLRFRVGLLVRYVLTCFLGTAADRPCPPVLEFFGVSITNTTMAEAIDWLVERARSRTPSLVAFVNPDCLNIAYRNEEYRKVLRTAARVLPDGSGVNLGCKVLGVSLAANVNGTDLFPRLCERAAAEGLSLFLLGGRPGVAEDAAKNMVQRFPSLRFAGTSPGYLEADEEKKVIDRVNTSGADFLLVGLGAPRQELWLARTAQFLEAPVRLGVGGLFDYYSGRIPRAPLWLRELGLEWTWRLLMEPRRLWKRYLVGNPLFLYRVWKQARGRSVT